MAIFLVVDDSPVTRKTVCKIIKEEGHDTMEASNGREGLEIINTHKPDCIILDLIMPEVGGFEVLETLRDRGSKIPVIVLTADIQKIVKQECIDLGAKAFLNKPMLKKELRGKINKVLGLEKENAHESDT